MKWTSVISLLTYLVTTTLALARTEVVCGSDGRTYADEEELLLAEAEYPGLHPVHYGPCHNVPHINQQVVCANDGRSYKRHNLVLKRQTDPSLQVVHLGPCSPYEDETQLDKNFRITRNTVVCGNDLRTYRYQHLKLAQLEDPHLEILHPGPCGLNVMPVNPNLKRLGHHVGRNALGPGVATKSVGKDAFIKGVRGKGSIGRSAMGAVVGGNNQEAEGAGLGNYGGYEKSSSSSSSSSSSYVWSNNGWVLQSCDQPGSSCHNQNTGQCGLPGQPLCTYLYPYQYQYPGQCGRPGQPLCQNNLVRPQQCGLPGQPLCQNNLVPPQQCGLPGQPLCQNNLAPPQQCGFPGRPCINSGIQTCGYGQNCYGLGAGGLGSAPKEESNGVSVETRSGRLRERKAKREGRGGGMSLWEFGKNGVVLAGRSVPEVDKNLEDRGNRSKRSAGQWVPHELQNKASGHGVSGRSENWGVGLRVGNLRGNYVNLSGMVGRSGWGGSRPLPVGSFHLEKYPGRSGWGGYVPLQPPSRHLQSDRYPGRSGWGGHVAQPPSKYLPVAKYLGRSGWVGNIPPKLNYVQVDKYPGRSGVPPLPSSIYMPVVKPLGRHGWGGPPPTPGYPPAGWSGPAGDLQTGRYPGSGRVARCGGSGGEDCPYVATSAHGTGKVTAVPINLREGYPNTVVVLPPKAREWPSYTR